MTKCPRCNRDVIAVTCSYFNTEDICLRCKADEHGCPNYQKAYDAETQAVRNQDFNFPGIGLAFEDLAHITKCLEAHRVVK